MKIKVIKGKDVVKSPYLVTKPQPSIQRSVATTVQGWVDEYKQQRSNADEYARERLFGK